MTDATYTPTKHSSIVGGSSAARVLACPGSVRLNQSLNLPDVESPYAAEGTALHNAVEHALYEGLAPDDLADELLGKEFYGHKLNAEQVRTVASALRSFDALYSELELDDGEVLTYAVETSSAFPGIPDAFGTADILMVTPKRSLVLDWKFGAGVPVSAEENKQGMFYAAAAAHSSPQFFWPEGMNEMHPGAHDRLVEIVVVQPRIGDGEPSRWQTTYGALRVFETDLREAVETIDNKDVTFARGDHCRWCGGAPTCPLYQKVAEQVNDLFTNPPVETAGPTEVVGQQIADIVSPAMKQAAPVDPAVLTPKVLGEMMAKAEMIELWAKSVRGLAHEMAESGTIAEGYKLVRKYGNLAWVNDDPKKVDKSLANKGLLVRERQKRVPLTPTQINAVLKKKGKPPLSENLAVRPVTGTKLVPERAKGEPVQTALAAPPVDVSGAFR